ncbi:MAG: substrate-binding domain-containing protein [Candidatus Thermoplasmatota archaeon]|nr:substrate-binding domain-containing protein [Candidatus Thermoplasmatota archaeon]
MVKGIKNNWKKTGAVIIAIVLLVVGMITWRYIEREDELLLATTTSTYDSGLLDEIIPHFEKEFDVRVKVMALGTGQALELGKRGDADVLLVHAPELEMEFVKDGYGEYRYEVMYNEYVVVGPEEDPAGINGLENTNESFQRIYNNQSSVNFCSRGDDSGTHTKEKALWEKAGFDYGDIDSEKHSSWYKSLGQGMGDTLRVADEEDAYVLTDEATYLSMEDELDDMKIHVQGDTNLFNQYGVIPVNGTMHSGVNQGLAEDFADWITSDDIQNMIDEYTVHGKESFDANAYEE